MLKEPSKTGNRVNITGLKNDGFEVHIIISSQKRIFDVEKVRLPGLF